MGKFVADATVKQMIKAGKAPKNSKVVIMGLTFKENCPDTRNSKVNDIIKQLNTYEIKPIVVDPWASERDAMNEYGIRLTDISEVKDADCIIISVAHAEFKNLSLEEIDKMYGKYTQSEKILIDVKGIFTIESVKKMGFSYWRL